MLVKRHANVELLCVRKIRQSLLQETRDRQREYGYNEQLSNR